MRFPPAPKASPTPEPLPWDDDEPLDDEPPPRLHGWDMHYSEEQRDYLEGDRHG